MCPEARMAGELGHASAMEDRCRGGASRGGDWEKRLAGAGVGEERRSGTDSGRTDHAKTQFCPSTYLTRADEGGGTTEGILVPSSTEHEHCHPLDLARWMV